MKKNILKFGLPALLLVVATSVIGPSCSGSSSDPVEITPPCSTINTPFQQLFNQTKATNPTFTDHVSIDLLTHEYTFLVNTDKTICSVGYQGNANLFASSLPYKIEIVDYSTSSVLYSGNHLFNSSAINYVSISPVHLIANKLYTIRRSIPSGGYLGDLFNATGRVLSLTTASDLPVTFGALTIKSSNFYGSGGPLLNAAIPYIDIVFQ